MQPRSLWRRPLTCLCSCAIWFLQALVATLKSAFAFSQSLTKCMEKIAQVGLGLGWGCMQPLQVSGGHNCAAQQLLRCRLQYTAAAGGAIVCGIVCPVCLASAPLSASGKPC